MLKIITRHDKTLESLITQAERLTVKPIVKDPNLWKQPSSMTRF